MTAASAISALQEAGGKLTRLRTSVLNQGYRAIVEQVMWLISQFYDRRRVLFITGREAGRAREVNASPERLFGAAQPGASLPPPPYTVQVQVQRRNPLRQQAQNELFLQAYEMSAKAGQAFPLSMLFELLQVDGKERVLPVIRANEAMLARLEALERENEELRAMCGEADALMTRMREGAARQQTELEKAVSGQGSDAEGKAEAAAMKEKEDAEDGERMA